MSFAIEMQGHLRQLRAERALAAIEGLAEDGAYVADLEEEIALASDAYTAAAVTEIATLRGELHGRPQG